MQTLIEFIARFVAMLAAAALSQFGVELDPRETPSREVHRVGDCGDGPSAAILVAGVEGQKDC